MRRPRIGVGVRALAARERRGVALYEFEVLKAMAQLNPEIDFVLLGDTPLDHDQIPHERLNFRLYPVQRGWRFNFWLQAVLPYAAVRERLDLLWCPANEVPFVQTVPCVVTVHDAKILSRRETILGRYYHDRGRLMPAAFRPAKRILADSAFTKSQILKHAACPPERNQDRPLR